MNIARLLEYPTTLNTTRGEVHESVLRSYQTLEAVREMLKRGDSAQTILEILNYVDQRDSGPRALYQDGETTQLH